MADELLAAIGDCQQQDTILVVDDNDINRIVLSSMLEKFNFKADEAQHGRIAVEMAKAKPYDIIFMDLQMPYLDGIEATRQILDQTRVGQRPRIVALTANVSEDNRQKCLSVGMDGFISKPFSLIELQRALEK